MSDDHQIPSDGFSRVLRMLKSRPDSVEANSTISITDFLGNTETWVVTTIRADGEEYVFIQRNGAQGGTRFVLPCEVTSVLNRQRARLLGVVRRRSTRQGLATRRLRGDTIGNIEALRKARSARKKATK
jgi:hypothetical protein